MYSIPIFFLIIKLAYFVIHKKLKLNTSIDGNMSNVPNIKVSNVYYHAFVVKVFTLLA